MKYYNLLSLLSAGLLLVACSQEEARPPHTAEQQRITPAAEYGQLLSLDLEGSLPQDQARAMAFELTNSGPKLQMTEQAMPSTIIISNRDHTQVYYASIEWNKTAGSNHLYFRGTPTSLTTGKPLQIPQGEWYMMGYVGGSYDASAQHISYDPNGSTLTLGKEGEQIQKPVPVYFPWTKLELKSSGSSTTGYTTIGSSDKNTIRFQALGTMMRVEFTNDMDYDVDYSSITYQSHVLSTGAGYYDLSSLPQIPQDPDTELAAPSTWVTTSSQEPKYTFVQEGKPSVISVTSKQTSPLYALVWAMPHSSTDTRNRAITHILADATRKLNGKAMDIPQMKTIYIWGSSTQPRERTRVVQKTKLVRDKLFIEYFDTDYMRTSYHNYATTTTAEYKSKTGAEVRKDLLTVIDIEKPQTVVDSITETIEQWLQLPEADRDNVLYFFNKDLSRDDFLAEEYRNRWEVPSNLGELRKLFLNVGSRFDSEVRRDFDYSVNINGKETKYTDNFHNQPNKPAYLLRFDDQGNRRQYIAARYSTSPQGFTIEEVFLGPHYKGDLEDIEQDSFWSLHKSDIVSRSYYTSLAIYMQGDQYYDLKWLYVLSCNRASIHLTPSNIATCVDLQQAYMYRDRKGSKQYNLDIGEALNQQYRRQSIDLSLNYAENGSRDQPCNILAPIVLKQRSGIGWDD